MKKFIASLSWVFVTCFTLFLSLSAYTHLASIPKKSFRPKVTEAKNDTIASQAVLPEVLGAFTYSVTSSDAIPEIIKKYLKRYDSPLLPYADFLVKTAREYNMDPRLLIAIAQQESNLCKKIPDDSHNCWGWGIHSQGTLKFPSYKEAIEAVTKGISEKYLGRGLTTPEDIMGIYTPLSRGSWASGVQQFLDDMN